MNFGLTRSVAVTFLVSALFLLFVPVSRADDTAALYKSKCAMCHKADGSGNAGMKVPDFRSAAIQKETDAQLVEATANGKGKMPAQKGKLTEAQIKDLVKYIRELTKK
ncbi:MAG TPA: cytochrome c [Candidatus Acidoferrales bacterium]|nr:cytochrome c [Candidatus Acidoferrales bacterium]